jgi:hypothetical protein
MAVQDMPSKRRIFPDSTFAPCSLDSLSSQILRDLLASLQRLPGGFLGSDDEQSDLTDSELVILVLRTDREDLLDGGQDRLGDERGAVDPLFNPPSEHAVEGLGIEPSSA